VRRIRFSRHAPAAVGAHERACARCKPKTHRLGSRPCALQWVAAVASGIGPRRTLAQHPIRDYGRRPDERKHESDGGSGANGANGANDRPGDLSPGDRQGSHKWEQCGEEEHDKPRLLSLALRRAQGQPTAKKMALRPAFPRISIPATSSKSPSRVRSTAMPPITVRARGSAGMARPMRRPGKKESALISRLKRKRNGSRRVIPSPTGEAGDARSPRARIAAGGRKDHRHRATPHAARTQNTACPSQGEYAVRRQTIERQCEPRSEGGSQWAQA
jgi:hypothetical protein